MPTMIEQKQQKSSSEFFAWGEEMKFDELVCVYLYLQSVALDNLHIVLEQKWLLRIKSAHVHYDGYKDGHALEFWNNNAAYIAW